MDKRTLGEKDTAFLRNIRNRSHSGTFQQTWILE